MTTANTETGVGSVAADSGDFHARLELVAKKFSRSEIARKTGTPVANVSRYMRGAAVPASFCCRLVESFGINPNWLMTGEGAPFLAEASTETGEMASGMSSLVQALNAVVKMRLGALVGKEHGRQLRQLNEALKEYKLLRERLNRQTMPLYEKLLGDLEDLTRRANFADAAYIQRALRQLADINDTPTLALRLAEIEINLAYGRGQHDEAFKQAKIAFEHALSSDWLPDDSRLRHAIRYAATLHRLGRHEESRHVAEGALHLCYRAKDHPNYAHLQFTRASADVSVGNLREGLAAQADAYPRLYPDIRAMCRFNYSYTGMLAGSLSLEEVFAADRKLLKSATPQQLAFGANRMLLGCWEEDEALLREIIAFYYRPESETKTISAAIPAYAIALAEVLAGNPNAIPAFQKHPAIKEALESSDLTDCFGVRVGYCQLLVLAGKTRPALDTILAIEEWKRDVPPGVSLDILDYGVHYRNVLRCVPENTAETRLRALRGDALAFFDEYRRRGYGCFFRDFDLPRRSNSRPRRPMKRSRKSASAGK